MNNISDEIIEFKKVLKDLNIELKQNSELDLSLARLNDYLKIQEFNKDGTIHLRDCAKILRQSIFLDGFIRNINKLRNRNDFYLIKNHITLLLDTNFAQNDSTPELYGKKKEDNNKVWELFLIIALMNINAEIILVDDPKGSNSNKNKNKKKIDIIANLEGVRFGFECKVPGSDSLNAQSFFDLIKTGVVQIIESDVDFGIVCLNMKNIINHNKFLESADNNYECFSDVQEMQNLLKTEIIYNWKNKIAPELKKWIETKGQNEEEQTQFIYEEIFKNNKKTCKGWFNYYSTGSICLDQDKVNAVSLQILNPQGIRPEDFCIENVVANQINNGFFEKEKNYSLLKYLKEYRNNN